MISRASVNKIVHKLHLDEFIKSVNECRKDNRGGFLIPRSSKVTDTDYSKYRHLPVNWSLPPITKDVLPDEFSHHAVKTADMFRRKTFDLNYECMIYFDYVTGEIVSCNFSDENSYDRVQSLIYPYLLKGMNIASIHNHPFPYSAPPSGKNFGMLGLEFEDFELIFSKHELWILESQEKVFSDDEVEQIRNDVDSFYESISHDVNLNLGESYHVMENVNRFYGDFLLTYLNDVNNNIKLTRRYFDD